MRDLSRCARVLTRARTTITLMRTFHYEKSLPARKSTHKRTASRRDLAVDKKYLLALEGPRCNLCGTTEAFLAVDHIVPRARGGSEHLSNLQLVCEPCNYRKADLDVAGLYAIGHAALARRLREVLNSRTSWTDDEIVTRLQAAEREHADISYQPYRLYTAQTAFGKALTERMQTCGIAESRLRRELETIVGNCYGKNIGRWRRSTYPSPPFFRALSIILDWPIKTMCHYVDAAHYHFAPRARCCFPLLPHLLQRAWNIRNLLSEVIHRAPELHRDVKHYLQTGVLFKEIIPILCDILPTLTPELLRDCSVEIVANPANTPRPAPRLNSFPRLPNLHSPTEAARLKAFYLWLSIKRWDAGWTAAAMQACLTKKVSLAYFWKMLSSKSTKPITLEAWALHCFLLDLDIYEVPTPIMPDCWKPHLQTISDETKTWQQTLVKYALSQNGQSYGALGRQCNLKNHDTARQWLTRRHIPTFRFPAIREFLGWRTPTLTAAQRSVMNGHQTRWKIELDQVLRILG